LELETLTEVMSRLVKKTAKELCLGLVLMDIRCVDCVSEESCGT
jgi:hypothetical protein